MIDHSFFFFFKETERWHGDIHSSVSSRSSFTSEGSLLYLASSFGRSVALWSSPELSNSISPLWHYKGNNNNSCTYHTEDLTEKHDAKMTWEKAVSPRLAFLAKLLHLFFFGFVFFNGWSPLRPLCSFILRRGVVLRVNNKEHAVGATASALNERISLNGIFIFSSVRGRAGRAAQRGEPVPGVVWHFDPFETVSSPPKLVVHIAVRAIRLCGSEGAVCVFVCVCVCVCDWEREGEREGEKKGE